MCWKLFCCQISCVFQKMYLTCRLVHCTSEYDNFILLLKECCPIFNLECPILVCSIWCIHRYFVAFCFIFPNWTWLSVEPPPIPIECYFLGRHSWHEIHLWYATLNLWIYTNTCFLCIIQLCTALFHFKYILNILCSVSVFVISYTYWIPHNIYSMHTVHLPLFYCMENFIHIHVDNTQNCLSCIHMYFYIYNVYCVCILCHSNLIMW